MQQEQPQVNRNNMVSDVQPNGLIHTQTKYAIIATGILHLGRNNLEINEENKEIVDNAVKREENHLKTTQIF